MKEVLENLDGVISVEVVEPQEGASFFSEKYIVTFEQPLDWSDLSKGTFPQRVEVGLCDDAEINVLETNGYALMDAMAPGMTLGMDDQPEMTHLITKSGNYFNVEHRFFGGSRPADLQNTEVKYWEYHTPENAANDYHKIYTTLAPLFGDRWVSVGNSRGGLMTNVYAMYFPDDMRAFIPYVAPCSDGLYSDSMYQFVYEEIGDEAYGKETAAKNRNIVTAFQVELLKHKADLMPNYSNLIENTLGLTFQNDLKDYSELYDLNVLEAALQIWQLSSKQDFDSLQEIIDMPEDSEEQKKEKEIALLVKLLDGIQSPQDWAVDYFAWPYYVNTATCYGQYLYDFSYLRKAMSKAGVEDTLSISADQEKDIPWKILFTPEQREAFVYDGTFRQELLSDMETTNAKHLMIFGATDPWVSQAVPAEVTSGNQNIKRYVNPDYPHDATISNMPEELRAEIVAVLEDWLAVE